MKKSSVMPIKAVFFGELNKLSGSSNTMLISEVSAVLFHTLGQEKTGITTPWWEFPIMTKKILPSSHHLSSPLYNISSVVKLNVSNSATWQKKHISLKTSHCCWSSQEKEKKEWPFFIRGGGFDFLLTNIWRAHWFQSVLASTNRSALKE